MTKILPLTEIEFKQRFVNKYSGYNEKVRLIIKEDSSFILRYLNDYGLDFYFHLKNGSRIASSSAGGVYQYNIEYVLYSQITDDISQRWTTEKKMQSYVDSWIQLCSRYITAHSALDKLKNGTDANYIADLVLATHIDLDKPIPVEDQPSIIQLIEYVENKLESVVEEEDSVKVAQEFLNNLKRDIDIINKRAVYTTLIRVVVFISKKVGDKLSDESIGRFIKFLADMSGF